MEPTTAVAARLASAAVAPLIRRLFAPQPEGARLVDRPIRISGLVSFKGEQQTLGEKDLHRLATELVDRAAAAYGPHEAPSAETRRELADALALALHSLGDLDMDDVQAVRLGPEDFAARLARPRHLSAAAEPYYDPLLHAASLHVLNFFSRRSSFVPRALTEQTRTLERLVALTDLLLERVPSRLAEDARFEERYVRHIAAKHCDITIYGLDLDQAREWHLDAAYVSLAATDATSMPLPADRALSGRDRVLLRGGAGSGKTTLVQWLAVTTARQKYEEFGDHLHHLVGRIPFVLPLRRVVRDGAPPTPDEFLRAVRSSVAGAEPPGWTDRVLSAGRALVLVDGMDEIPQRDRETTRRWLRELMTDFPGNLWLVTARPSAVAEDWLAAEGFTELTLSTMSHDDVTDFVRRWHTAAAAPPDLADALLTAVRTTTALGHLAVNPLMCGMLCALHRERNGFLPHSRKELYEAGLRMLLERRDLERGVQDELRLSSETQILLLQKLAHWMIRNDTAEMERADAVAQLSRALEYMPHVQAPAERVLAHLLERSGLLREPAHDRLDFVHRTFQDYLGAKALVEEGDFPLLLANADRDQWEDVVRMAVALGRPAERERILRGLVADIKRDALSDISRPTLAWALEFRRALLALACLEHATEVAPATRDHILGLTGRLLPPRDAETARIFMALGGPLVLGLLPGPEGLTDDAAWATVIAAADDGTEVGLSVIARFRGHPALKVRRQLVWSWKRFDCRRYAEEVVARVDPTDLYFPCWDPEHVEALRAMGGRERIQLRGRLRPSDMTEYLDTDRITHLWLARWTYRNSRDWLPAFPRLRTVVLEDAEERSAAAAELPPHITLLADPDQE
ncbi:NACHT domain-containing protein [Streptomyces yaizuensis]|uniref:NACHT domain-containing protein n=1 Tax=Streptomyces yaizuensis TaxID=2989713 RepID=A0ABQ5P434_9ACTN|nr:NACHT domain-containing protein [Streptomyces sp. YSPA8]GLF97368.1 NACHT domain-containing protein [Streptomyces sp. YSPA8]